MARHRGFQVRDYVASDGKVKGLEGSSVFGQLGHLRRVTKENHRIVCAPAQVSITAFQSHAQQRLIFFRGSILPFQLLNIGVSKRSLVGVSDPAWADRVTLSFLHSQHLVLHLFTFTYLFLGPIF